MTDDDTGAPVPDILRIEFAPLETTDAKLFARIFVARRDKVGEVMRDTSGTLLADIMFVRVVIGTIWEV